MKLAYGSIGWLQPMSHVATQISRIGYTGIEGFGMLDLLPEDTDLADLLAKQQLSFVGSFFSGSFVEAHRRQHELDDFRETCKRIAKWSGNVVTVGGGRLLKGHLEKEWKQFISTINEMSKIARAENVDLCFHPHLGTLVFTEAEISNFVRETTDDVWLCLDTAHLAVAGANLIQVFGQFYARLKHVHLKDCVVRGNSHGFDFLPLGEGQVDLRGVMRLLSASGYDNWVTIELDATVDPYGDAERSYKYIQQLLGA